MIYFGYPKLTFNISVASFARTVAYTYVHVQISPMLFCVDVLITQSTYRNRGTDHTLFHSLALAHGLKIFYTCKKNTQSKINKSSSIPSIQISRKESMRTLDVSVHKGRILIHWVYRLHSNQHKTHELQFSNTKYNWTKLLICVHVLSPW